MDQNVELALILKTIDLQRENSNLKYEELKSLLENKYWKKSYPRHVSDAINNIMSINAEELIEYLTSDAIINYGHLSDYKDLMGGKK